MKLHKANQTGSISIILPKDMVKMYGWEVGQEVVVLPSEDMTTLTIKNLTLNKEK